MDGSDPLCTPHGTVPVDSFPQHLTFKEVEEEGPVGTCFMTSVVLTISEAAFHQTVIHTREEVCAYAFIAKQFIDRRCL